MFVQKQQPRNCSIVNRPYSLWERWGLGTRLWFHWIIVPVCRLIMLSSTKTTKMVMLVFNEVRCLVGGTRLGQQVIFTYCNLDHSPANSYWTTTHAFIYPRLTFPCLLSISLHSRPHSLGGGSLQYCATCMVPLNFLENGFLICSLPCFLSREST